MRLEAATSRIMPSAEMSAVSLQARAVSTAGSSWVRMASTTMGPMLGRRATSI